MAPEAQPANASTANLGISFIPRNPRASIIRPVNYTPRTSRASSLSDTEETGLLTVPSAASKEVAGPTSRLSMLPRPNSSRRLSSTSPFPFVIPKPAPSPIPSTLSSPEFSNPSAFNTTRPVTPVKKPRNVLRRKAATIGQHEGKHETQKIGLVIPPEALSNDVTASSLSTFPESQLPRPSTAPQATYNDEKKVVEPPKTHPKELASLRTTIDTQNLPPPPTPFFGSASSPSTRYSESPGVWSRTSTPTTLSSCSPGIVQSAKVGRLRQPSPSQTRLPIFSPSPSHTSPQNERGLTRTPNPALASKLSPVAAPAERKPQRSKHAATKIRGPPRSPPPRKSSMNFSPPKNSEIDVERAWKEVEEAERALRETQRTLGVSPAATSATPPMPRRPSRDGTDHLELEISPVIQSNLPYLRSTGHTRRESAEKIMTAKQMHPTPNQAATTSVDTLQSSAVSRTSSREGDSPVMSRGSPRTLSKEPPAEKPDPKKTAAPRRFGIFTKKPKPDTTDRAALQARPHRKGPAAGTGHEGYGKYSQRGRKSSVSSSSGTRTRSTSTTRSAARSVASSKGSLFSRPDLEIDDFLMSRLEPVVISGGGTDGAALSRTQSEQSISSVSVASTSNLPRQTAAPSSAPQATDSTASSTAAFVDLGTPNEAGSGLGLIRVNSPDPAPTATDPPRQPKSRMPLPERKRYSIFASPEASATQTSLSSHDSGFGRVHQPADPAPTAAQTEQLRQDEKQSKKGKTSRLKIFQRNRGNDQKSPASTTPSQTAQLHAAVSPVVNTRPVAHYALVDADSDSLDEIFNAIEESPPTEEDEYLKSVEVPAGLNIRKKQQSILLPSPPKLHGQFQRNDQPSPRTALFNPNVMGPESQPSQEALRPRRLASVGRIPQVVSRRDRQHRPAIQSFSRPFSGCDSPNLMAPATDVPFQPLVPNEFPWAVPKDVKFGQPQDASYFLNQAFNAPEQACALDFLAGPYSNNEFIHFSLRKESDSSSSSGALAAVTAFPPEPGSAPTEDEVWNEYDDLLDYALSPEETEANDPEAPDDGGKFEMVTMASKTLQDELSSLNPMQRATPMSAEAAARSSSDSMRLRRSKIMSALRSSTAPSSQPSYTDLIAGYAERTTEIPNTANCDQPGLSPTHLGEQQSTVLHSLAAAPGAKPSSHSDRRPVPGSSERDWDDVTRTNMRSASLMTSRWLSFGRVLFSPAHNHVKTGGHGRILVIDGLGNDDWSFYCSLTYPDAEVYSLSGRPVSTAIPHPAAWQPPTNHHTVYHTGLHSPLPFPKDYFTVTVLRFPAACSEEVQSNIVQESKRVLRSGGYLEMSLLDRDLVNMGERSRKAVRRLKEMTCLANSSTSLKPTSDSVQRLLGAHGFDNLRRCMVHIPVARVVLRSSDSTTSSSNRSITTLAIPSTSFSIPTISVPTEMGSSQTTQKHSKSKSKSKSSAEDDTTVSLGDLLSDPTPSPTNDESIAKIVARVGRWWYTKCYEDPVLPGTGETDLPSMWNDRKVMRECQKRGTGFRMLIAYAQKPSEVKRRTASV